MKVSGTDQKTPGMLDSSQTGDRFGTALATGDIDNDSYDDLAIGVPGATPRLS